jgi:hypothetical protein
VSKGKVKLTSSLVSDKVKPSQDKGKKIVEKTLTEIREQGIGSNFTVLHPSDGYRKDDRLWFGTCDTCGQRVVNSVFDKTWNHTILLGRNTSRQVDYCTKYLDFNLAPLE